MSIKTKLIILFIAFSIAPIVILGPMSVKRAQDYAQEETLARLRSMADDKARLVESFFAERMGDVQVTQKAYVLQTTMPLLDRYLDEQQNPGFAEALAAAGMQLTELKKSMNYNDVIVVNPAGRVLFAVASNEPGKKPGDKYHDRDGKTLAQGRTGRYLSEVYVDQEGGGNRELAISAPVNNEAGQLLGMLILEVDLDLVFKDIGETGALGQTGEMVIVKRDGDAVKFLSPRRFLPEAPLDETVPFRPNGDVFPAQAAVTGQTGAGKAMDYLGVPVLADWRPLPDLGWGLVVKIKEEEVLAPGRYQMELVVVIGIGVILLGSLLAWMFGQTLTRPLVQLERGAEIIGGGDLDHQIEHRGRDEVGRLAEAFNQMTQRLKTVTASRDELNIEIEERKRAEAEAARVKRALFTLSQFNQSLVRAQGEDELLVHACRTLVEDGGYRFAWIGYKNDDAEKTVKPMTHAGIEEGYLEERVITWADDERRSGPAGLAIRSGESVIVQDLAACPALAPWREMALKRGYASLQALPLFEDERVLGALVVYAKEPDAFNEEESRLLRELADDLSYGISYHRTRLAHQRADEAVRQAAVYNRSLLEASLDPLVTIGPDGKITDVNQATEAVTGRKRSELIGSDFSDYFTDAEMARAGYQKVFKEGTVTDYPLEIKGADGRLTPVLYNASLYRDDTGAVIGIFAAARDVSARRRAEAEAARAKRALYTLSQVNQGLVRSKSEEELLPTVCRVLVEDGGYRMSWIGYKIDDLNKTVKPMAQAGFETGYLETAAITWDENSPRGRGPTGRCIRSRVPVVCQHMLTDPSFIPWREEAIKRGYASSFSAPLLDGDNVIGALMVYSADPDSFGEEEVKLLKELTEDLSYGIVFHRTRIAHQQADEQARKHEALLRQVVTNAPIILHALDRNEIITVSEGKGLAAFKRPAGWSAVGKSLAEVYGDNPLVIAANRRALAGESFHQDLYLGDTILSTWFEPLRDQSGEVSGMIGVSTDVTEFRREAAERERAEERVVAERQQFHEVLETLPAYVVLLTEDYHMPFANRIFRELFGASGGRRCFEFLFNRTEPCETCETYTVMKTGASHRWEWVGPNGRDYDIYDYPFTDTDGSKMILEMGIDITERKRANEHIQLRLRMTQLAESLGLEEFLQQTLDEIGAVTGSPIGFYHFVEPDQRTLALQAWSTRTLQEFCQAEGRGQHYDLDQAGVWADCLRERRPIIHNDYPSLAHKKGLPPGHAAVTRELVAPIFRGGKVVAIFGVGNKAQDYTQEDVDVITRFADIVWDIVERKRAEVAKDKAEEELAVQRALSIRADRLRSLGEMAAGIAHELNQPLAGVRGLAEHLLIGTERGWDLSSEKIQEKTRQIMGQADRMSHIIEHVRTFARGADGIEVEPIEVNQVIEDGLSLLGAQLESRGVHVVRELGQALPRVLANPFSLEEVVVNLVNNARDALEDNLARGLQTEPAMVKVRTYHLSGPNGGSVKIEVADNGPGLPAEIQGKIFEPFFTTKRPDKGTGLGLAISRSIVEKFNGSIELIPGPDRGAIATVSFPVFRPEQP